MCVVSVVATVASWMYKGNHPKKFQDQIIPLHVLPFIWSERTHFSARLGLEIGCFWSSIFHASKLLLTMQIWV